MKFFFKKSYSKISMYKSDMIYTSSNLFVPISGFVGSIIAVAYISPENMGIYQSVLLLLFYTNFMHLGVFQGLNRNISFYKAKNQLDVVQEQVNTSFTVALFVSIIGSLGGVLFFIYELFHDRNIYYLLAIVLLIINLVVIPLKTHFEATYRSSSQFGLLGKIIYKENLLFAITSLLPIVIGYYGKIISDSIKSIYSFYLRFSNLIIKSNGVGSKKQLFDLIKVGFPILISGYLWGLFVVADQSYIAISFDKVELGYYTLSKLIITSMIIVPNSINALLYPKMSALFAKTNKRSSLRQYIKKTILINAIIISPILIIAYFFVGDLVESFLPKYINGIEAAKINILACFSLIIMSPAVIFGILEKNKIYLIFLSVILSLFWFSCYALPDYFSTILIVAKFKFILSLILSLFVLLYTLFLTKENN